MSKPQFTAAQFIAALPGTGGVISAIAARVGCTWTTAKKYIETYPTIAEAYAAECERMLDLAESVVFQNVKLAQDLQRDSRLPVDTSDAKWLLSRKGKGRGYSERTEVAGVDGGPLAVSIIEVVKDHAGTD